jgi:hypothetical protein
MLNDYSNMKNPGQYRDSIMFTIISYVGAIIVVLITIMVSCTETTQKQHNFQVGELTAQDSLELKEPDAIYYDTIYGDDMRDVDMDCGDNKGIPKYESFYDVPASTDSIVIVGDISYKRGINRWTPVYPDECVMWVSSNGDTIWE